MNERNDFIDDDPSMNERHEGLHGAASSRSGDYPALAAIVAEYGIDGAFDELARQALRP